MNGFEITTLTSKHQATVPLRIRKILGLKGGDAVAFSVEGGEVKIRRAEPVDLAFATALAHTLEEWDSKEDDDAFGSL